MAKTDATETVVEQGPTEFPLTLEEYLSEQPASMVETKAGFRSVVDAAGISGARPRGEWASLLDLYNRQPAAMPWAEWMKSEANNKGGN